MKVLLDTCTFLWLNLDAPQLSQNARQTILDADNELYLSSVSAWEISVKYSIGKLRLPHPPSIFVPKYREANSIESLPLDEDSVLHQAKLPRIHDDPFDRMLVCQALAHGLTLLTPDENIARYPMLIHW